MLRAQEDRQRCEELRENDREIVRQLRTHEAVDRGKRSQLARLLDQHADLFARLSVLQFAVEVGRTAGGLAPGKIGAAIGGSTIAIAIEIPIIESQIKEINARIVAVREAVAANKDIFDLYIRNQRTGAEEMDNLNCRI